MEYASVSVRFPTELDAKIERYLEETGIYTDKSEFVTGACRSHLQHLNDDAAIAALRVGQLLAAAEASPRSDSEIEADLSALAETVDEADLEEALDAARDETADRVYGSDA